MTLLCPALFEAHLGGKHTETLALGGADPRHSGAPQPLWTEVNVSPGDLLRTLVFLKRSASDTGRLLVTELQLYHTPADRINYEIMYLEMTLAGIWSPRPSPGLCESRWEGFSA